MREWQEKLKRPQRISLRSLDCQIHSLAVFGFTL